MSDFTMALVGTLTVVLALLICLSIIAHAIFARRP